MMVTPATIDLTGKIGGTWNQAYRFYDDTSQTIPHSFAGVTAQFVLSYRSGGVATTVTGTAVISGNTITCSLTSAQTAALPATKIHYYISTSDGASPPTIEYYVNGAITFTAP